jgi:hypothetical protein
VTSTAGSDPVGRLVAARARARARARGPQEFSRRFSFRRLAAKSCGDPTPVPVPCFMAGVGGSARSSSRPVTQCLGGVAGASRAGAAALPRRLSNLSSGVVPKSGASAVAGVLLSCGTSATAERFTK